MGIANGEHAISASAMIVLAILGLIKEDFASVWQPVHGGWRTPITAWL